MEIMLKIWILFGVLVAVVIAQNSYDSDYLTQDRHYDSEEKTYHPSNSRHYQLRSYEPTPHEDVPSSDPRHYQSLEPRYPKHEPESYSPQPQYQRPQQVQFYQPEDPSYHRSQKVQYYQPEDPSYHKPQQVQYHHPEDPSYHRPQEIVYHQQPRHYKKVAPDHQQSYEGSTHYLQPEEKDEPKYTAEEPKYTAEEPKYTAEEPKYTPEEPKYTHATRPSHSPHPAPVPTDPKLPLYFTMYEKRVIQDPVDKYGKGPWRYLTYGHGITYGSKEPGKVFEKGYGYIRALGRDHCKLPEHLCPPKDDKPFDYEGRKEPYFGYRPH